MKKIKTLLKALMISVLLTGYIPGVSEAAQDLDEASLSDSSLEVDGEPCAASIYGVAGSNYIKIRDLAYILRDTQKKFNVEWQSESKSALILPNENYLYEYETEETSASLLKEENYTVLTAVSRVIMEKDGESHVRDLSAFNINDNNYFKIRDLLELLDIRVNYDAAKNIIEIDTSASYEKEDLQITDENTNLEETESEETEIEQTEINQTENPSENEFAEEDSAAEDFIEEDFTEAEINENLEETKTEAETKSETETEETTKGLERDYEWYIDQANTGVASQNNCGPSCAYMSAKWFDPSFDKSVEQIRWETTPSNIDNWWYTNNIADFYDNNGIIYKRESKVTEEKLLNELNNNNIIVLCINTKDLTYNPEPEQRFGKFYNFSDGHFVIVKGYSTDLENIYFEVYDSNSWGKTYNNGEYKGKNRYYLASELVNAAENWWNNYFVVYNPKS